LKEKPKNDDQNGEEILQKIQEKEDPEVIKIENQDISKHREGIDEKQGIDFGLI